MLSLRLFGLVGVLAATALGQIPVDGPGITVNLNEAVVMHRSPVSYPSAARMAGIQGTVIVEITLDPKGNVADAHIVSGPTELRRVVLETILEWHFAPNPNNASRRITIQFAPSPTPNSTSVARNRLASPIVVFQLGQKISDIRIVGLSPGAEADLTTRLPIHLSDRLTQELVDDTVVAVKGFDEHLMVGFTTKPNGECAIEIAIPGRVPSQLAQRTGRIRIEGDVQETKLRSAPAPDYPPEAVEARIQGTVKLSVVIAKDGSVQSVSLISGHPLLAAAAMRAVKQWSYEQTILNEVPVEVETAVDVPFVLNN